MNNMNKLVEEYIKNGKEIQQIKGETEEKKNKIIEERNNLWDVINEKRHLLEIETIKIRGDANDKIAIVDADEVKQTTPLINQRESVQRIVAFLETQEEFEPATFDNERRAREGKFSEWQDWMHNDDFLKIRLSIVENDKPVNKYTARAHIKSVFYKGLIELPSSPKELGSFKTIDEAKAYILKKKGTLFQEETKTLEALKLEYREVITAYKLSDFEELFEYYCSDCNAKFKTIPEYHEKKIITGYNEPPNYDKPVRAIVECKPAYGFRREVIT